MHNLLKVGLAVPRLWLADPTKNATAIIQLIEQAEAEHVELLVFPELAITGATCGDLFRSQQLLIQAEEALQAITHATANKHVLCVVGTPVRHNHQVYNAMAILHQGHVSHYHPKDIDATQARFFDQVRTPFVAQNGTFYARMEKPVLRFEHKQVRLAIVQHLADYDTAHVLIDPWQKTSSALSADRAHAVAISRRNKAYVSLSSGSYESSTDHVYTGQLLVAEQGQVFIDDQALFEERLQTTYLDYDGLIARDGHEVEHPCQPQNPWRVATFSEKVHVFPSHEMPLSPDAREPYSEAALRADVAQLRQVSPTPYLPASPNGYSQIIALQATALARRLMAAHAKSAVVGVSGGLDSTLALIATCEAFTLLGWDTQGIIAVTLPGFGTSQQTYANAYGLVKALGVTLREIDIVPSVALHLSDIGHDGITPDVTYENAQARERTQILMDLANMHQGIVIGTGDLSEAMLGFSTYNGDHMSMYNPNAGLLKTVIQHTLTHLGSLRPELQSCLSAIVDTPISPELLPTMDNHIAQKTEAILGSYLLNDFIIYHHLRGVTPAKLLFLARIAFEPQGMGKAQLKEALKNFYRRYFASQFKRSASPDGPDVMDMSASPRGGLVMPSDATANSWLQAIEAL